MNSKPFIVAELSANHNGSINRALRIVDAAADAGADAIKLQTFNPKKMAIPGYKIKSGPWKDRELQDLYREAYTPIEWHEQLFEYARSRDLIPFSSPFDDESVDFLETLDCPIYKIASFELIDIPLIAKVAKTGKPMIMSTGMAELYEIRAAINTARANGCKDLTLLHCVSSYPAKPEDINLRTMDGLKRFGCKVGLSDHTRGTAVSVAAVARGAEVIEKHLTLDRADGGLDAGFSMEPDEFESLVNDCNNAHKAIGKIVFGGESKDLRRSLYYTQDIKRGTILEPHHIKTARPALGISPLRISQVIGQKLKKDVTENEPV